MKSQVLRVPALEIHQNGRPLYLFAVEAKLLHSFATVSRVHRAGNTIHGYQRPEVLSHVAEIRAYLETDEAILPGSIVLAFDSTVRFQTNGNRGMGMLTIPLTEDDAHKPAWIVDGQQRAAAVRDLNREGFPVCVTAFVAHDEDEQREQFILVNNTKPLPKGLVYELLPQTSTLLPHRLARQLFPVQLLGRLNMDEDSPLKGRIRTATMPDGVIKDTAVLHTLNNSLADGVLYRFRGREDGNLDMEGMLTVLKDYWAAVAMVFADAWERPPRLSRLTHGAGFVALGFVMDEIAEEYREKGVPTQQQFIEHLSRLKPFCHWIAESGDWVFDGCQRRWNEFQNTPRDTRLLANLLCREYRRTRQRNRRAD